jgi:hypothetical protein
MVFTKQLIDVKGVQTAFKRFVAEHSDRLDGKGRLHLAYDVAFEWKLGKRSR